MEKLIGLIIFGIVAALGQWLQKKMAAGENQDSPGYPPQPPRTPPLPDTRREFSNPSFDRQREIKRAIRHAIEREIKPPFVQMPAPPRIPQTQPPSIRPLVNEVSEEERVYPSPLRTADAAQARASAMDRQVAERLQKIQPKSSSLLHPVKRPPALKKTRSQEMHQSLKWKNTPAGLRQAIIASVVLGPPKALEN
jgi:hypothetical protein